MLRVNQKYIFLLGIVICTILGNMAYDTYYTNSVLKTLDTLYSDSANVTQVADNVVTRDVIVDYVYNNFKDNTNELVNTTTSKDNIDNRVYVKGPYHIDEKGKDLIKDFEKCRLTAYKYHNKKSGHTEKYYTVGWGHVIYPGDKTPMHLTREQADNLFDEDMKKYEQMCTRLLNGLDPRFKFTQGFVNGMVSFIYNCGEKGARKSKFYQRLKACRFDANGNVNKKDFEYAIEGIKTSHVYEPGHKPRRHREYTMIETGKSTKQCKFIEFYG